MASKTDTASNKSDQHKLWLLELQGVLAEARSGNGDHKKLVTTYYKSIGQLNLLLALTIPLGRDDGDSTSRWFIIDNIRIMQEVFGEIMPIHSLLPKAVFAADQPISYAGVHSRSWAGIVLGHLSALLTVTSMPSGTSLSKREALQLLDKRGFEAAFVKVHLEIEREQIQSRIAATSGTQQTAITASVKPRGPKPDPDKDRIEEQYRRMGKGAKYSDIAEILDLKKWCGRLPDKRVERVVNAMQKREQR